MTGNIFKTLRYRNFRLFFVGQSISLVGTWIQQIAMGWLVYRITNSAFALGAIGFLSQIPTFVLSPFAGVVADRWDRRRTLIFTQALSAVQAVILAFLTFTNMIAVWHVVVLGIFLGCVNSLDIPVRQSFLVEMVEKKEDLGNAIALNSFMFNSARLVGPSLAGLIIALAGEGVCFLVNAVSFAAVIVSLLAMDLVMRESKRDISHVLETLKEGFVYTFGFAPIRLILAVVGVSSFVGTSYMVLMPVFARDILKGGPSTLGFLTASGGVGALAATIYLASRRSVLGMSRLIPVSLSVFAVGVMGFSLSGFFWLSAIFLAVAGFGFMAGMASCNTILQTIVEDALRGRVMSFYVMAFIGMSPLGSLAAGSLASGIGAAPALVAESILVILVSALFAGKIPLLKKLIHPIYRKIGIIPEVASGIGAATNVSLPPEE